MGYQTDRLIKEQRRRLCTSCEQLLSNHLESQRLRVRAAVERVSDEVELITLTHKSKACSESYLLFVTDTTDMSV